MIIGTGLHIEEAQTPQLDDDADALAGKASEAAQAVGLS
jgi:hypothetical protein